MMPGRLCLFTFCICALMAGVCCAEHSFLVNLNTKTQEKITGFENAGHDPENLGHSLLVKTNTINKSTGNNRVYKVNFHSQVESERFKSMVNGPKKLEFRYDFLANSGHQDTVVKKKCLFRPLMLFCRDIVTVVPSRADRFNIDAEELSVKAEGMEEAHPFRSGIGESYSYAGDE
jgi:hypothetical protein